MTTKADRARTFAALAKEFDINDCPLAEFDAEGDEGAQYAVLLESALEGDSALMIADTMEGALGEAADGDMREGTLIVDLNTGTRYSVGIPSVTVTAISPEGKEIARRTVGEGA